MAMDTYIKYGLCFEERFHELIIGWGLLGPCVDLESGTEVPIE